MKTSPSEQILEQKLQEAEKEIAAEHPAKEIRVGKQRQTDQRTQAERLVELIEESEVMLFHDQFKEAYAAIHGDGREVLKIRSKMFRRWITCLAWEEMNKALSGETLQSAIQILEGKALFNGDLYELHVRMARVDEAIWYDLGDGRAVCINREGWAIIDRPPILFRRLPHQQAQTEPLRDGDIHELLSFVNLAPTTEVADLNDEQILYLAWLTVGFIAGFPKPILVCYGPQGSAKSTLSRISKALLDPSMLGVLTLPRDIHEFVQMVSHHWFVPFDNVTSLSGQLSDALCRACTGDGFSKRELYTDDDDIIYSFQRALCLNAINLPVERSDLLDRCVLIAMNRMKRFESETELWKRFDERKPYILGSIFDTLVRALKEMEFVSTPSDLRMADFARWCCAVMRALGYEETRFLKAYTNNIARQHQEAIDANPTALALIDLMAGRLEWSGSPTALLEALEVVAIGLKLNQRSKLWPKDPRWVWRRVKEAVPNLEAQGISVERERGDKRIITIQKRAASVDNDDGDVETTKPTASTDGQHPDNNQQNNDLEETTPQRSFGNTDDIDITSSISVESPLIL